MAASDIGAGTLIVALGLVRDAGAKGITAGELAFGMGVGVPAAVGYLRELHRRHLAEPVPHVGREARMRETTPAAGEGEY